MRIKLVPRLDDIEMIEIWTRSGSKWYLAAVAHGDNFLGTPILDEINRAKEHLRAPESVRRGRSEVLCELISIGELAAED